MTKQSWLIFSKTLFDMADMVKDSRYKPDERLVKAIEKLLRDTLEKLKEKE